MQEFDQQLGADPRDDHERTVHQRRIPFHQREQLADHQPHHDDAQHAAGQNHPQLRRHGHGDQNRIDGKHDIGQFDLDDRRPERRQPHPRLCFGRFSPFVAALARPEVAVDEEQQVAGADHLHPRQADEVNRQQRCKCPEGKRAQDAVTERLTLLCFGEAENEHRQHHGVVGAQQTFERDEKRDSDEIRDLNRADDVRHV
jgi:hypothetical protein